MESIEFQNRKYKVREIKLPLIGWVLISTTSLNDALMNNSRDYVSTVAEKIDELIYFFTEDFEIEMNEKDLIKLVTLQTK